LSIFLAAAVKELVTNCYQEHIVPQLVKLAMRDRELRPYRQRERARAEGRVPEIGIAAAPNLQF